MNSLRSLLVACTLLIGSADAYAQQMGDAAYHSWSAGLTSPAGSKITWDEDQIKIDSSAGYQRAELSGTLPPNSKDLKLNGRPIPFNASMGFKLMFGFQGKDKNFTLSYLDAQNTSVSENFSLSDLTSSKGLKTPQTPVSRSLFSLGAGYTFLHYDQTRITSFDERAMSVKGGFQYRLSRHWDFGLGAFYNAAITKNSSVATATSPAHSIKFLGVNGKFGYQFLPDSRTVQFALQGGVYYNTSFGDVGISGLVGPQLYPVLTFWLKEDRAIKVYAKFSPLQANGETFNPAKNHELAAGASYSLSLGRKTVFFAYDYSNLKLSESSVDSALTTSTLSFGIGF